MTQQLHRQLLAYCGYEPAYDATLATITPQGGESVWQQQPQQSARRLVASFQGLTGIPILIDNGHDVDSIQQIKTDPDSV